MMPSPFPGMDPYLEDHWGDIHAVLTTYARDALSDQLPPDLRVRIEEYVAVEADVIDSATGFYPDVQVIERLQKVQTAEGGTATAAPPPAAQPHIVPLTAEPPTQREIRIVDRRSNDRIISAIEFLSPTNKGRGRADYRRKQRQFLDSHTNLVEIDLLRTGGWVIAAPIDAAPNACLGPYRICIVRGAKPDRAEMFEASYRFPLPRIPIPLREREADVTLDLQALLDRAYETGRYADDIDYRNEPIPALPPAEAAWMHEWLSQRGLR
jgi:hypothetical protein